MASSIAGPSVGQTVEEPRISALDYDPVFTLNILSILVRIGLVFSLTIIPCLVVLINCAQSTPANDCYVLRFGLLAHAVLQCCQLPLRCVIYKKLKVVRSGMSISPANILASRIRDLERERAWELNQVFAIFVYLNCSILAATTVYHTFWAQTEDTGGLLRACWFLIFCFFSRICGTFIWSWLYFSRQQLMGATSKELQELNCRCFEQDDSTVSCVICMMDFSSSEEVCALPCSDKHIFHSSCVRKWLKVSKLCPLCMKPIAGPKAKYK